MKGISTYMYILLFISFGHESPAMHSGIWVVYLSNKSECLSFHSLPVTHHDKPLQQVST